MIKPNIHYYKNGNKASEIFILKGVLHNENGPAKIYYYESGNKNSDYYFLNGMLHNENGPAIIYYYEDGNKDSERYYLNNIYLPDIKSTEELKRYIKRLNIT